MRYWKMLKRIKVKNFKSLKDTSFNLANLNVLTGLNGSGKSSLIQAMLLLRQTFLDANLKQIKGLFLQGGNLVNLGSGKDVFYQYASGNELIEFQVEGADGLEYQWSFSYKTDSDILPIKSRTQGNLYKGINLFNKHFQYLQTNRISPQVTYLRSDYQIENIGDIGVRGEFAAHFLSRYGFSKEITNSLLLHSKARSNYLLHQIDAWISEISPGLKFVAEDIKDTGQTRLAIQFETKSGYTNEIKPINTGFGISYILPLVLSVLKATPGDLLILENPETHLHPRGQAVVGQLIAYAAQAGVQFILETHSDHIINGIRVAVKESKLSRKLVNFYYFNRVLNEDEQYSSIERLKIDRNGEFDSYPDGFLDEWSEQLMKLI